MTDSQKGRTFPLPRSRRTTNDLLRFTRKVPAHAQLRRCRIPKVAAARSMCPTRIGWPMVFFKAYARITDRMPELRRIFVARPYPRIYEHPVSIGRMTVSREIGGDDWVVLTKVDDPATTPIDELQSDVMQMAYGDPSDIALLTRQQRLASIPWPLRRVAWETVEWSGPWRAKWLGTFGLTTVSKFGATALMPPVFAGTTLSFGPVEKDGSVDIVIAYDHRVIDGAVPAKALAALEEELETAVATELRGLATPTIALRAA